MGPFHDPKKLDQNLWAEAQVFPHQTNQGRNSYCLETIFENMFFYVFKYVLKTTLISKLN